MEKETNSHLTIWSEPVFYISVSGVILAGAVDPIFSAWSYTGITYPCKDKKCDPISFDGFMAQLYMKYLFIGLLCLFMYCCDTRRMRKSYSTIIVDSEDIEKNRLYPKRKHIICLIGSSLDFSATITERLSTYYCKASTVGLIGNVSVLVSGIGNLFLNKRGIMVNEYCGVFILMTGGVAFSIMDSLSETEVHQENITLGIILATIGAICRGLNYIVQQEVFERRSYPATKYSAIESAMSFTWSIVFTIIFWAVNYVDPVEDFWKTVNSPVAFWGAFGFSFFSMWFNSLSMISAKYVSALFRMLVNRFGAVGTWMIEVAVGLGTFSYWSLAANIFVVVGSVVFSGFFISRTRFPKMFYAPVWGSILPPETATNYRKPHNEDFKATNYRKPCTEDLSCSSDDESIAKEEL